MTYTTGGLIQAADYNRFVQGGAAVDHNVANVNTIWGVGFGDRGYGQTGELATVPATSVVTATQWATLFARLNLIQTHQTNSNTNITSPVAGATISYINTLQTLVDTVYSNRAITGIQGTDSPVSTTTHVWNVATPTTFQIVRTFTFADPDQARYFFNAGGQLSLAFNATDALANLKGANWVSFLNTRLASFVIAGKSSRRTGTGGTVTSQLPAVGYWGLTTTDQTLLAVTSGSSTGVYDSNSISIKAKTNGLRGSNGDNGTIITVTIDFNDVDADLGTGNNINLSIGVNSTARRPETTALPTAIAYPALVAVSYSIVPNVASVNEGGTVTFTVSAPASPDGTVLYWTPTAATTATTADFVGGAVNGSVTITGGIGTFSRTLVNDNLSEGAETIIYDLRTASITGPIVATSSTVAINDTSAPGYTFTPTISATTTNYNLRSAAIAAGWNQVTPLLATVTVANGVVVGSTSTGAYAFDTGTGFPSGSNLSLVIGTGAYVVGTGGSANGGGGGPALRAQAAITINNQGTIAGGGGGGGAGAQVVSAQSFTDKDGVTSTTYYYAGGAGGGGGAGFNAGAGGPINGNNSNSAGASGRAGGDEPFAGSAGSTTAGGGGGAGGICYIIYDNSNVFFGGSGGAGGSLGAGGGAGGGGSTTGPAISTSSAASPGGAGGSAVVGNANITWANTGSRLGAIG